jgi:hypothetical protein
MDREALVYVDLAGRPHLVGRLWARARKDKESATFEYDKTWLEHKEQFSLEPALRLGPGPFHTTADVPMFGAIGDSAPDRWGRALTRLQFHRVHSTAGELRARLEEAYSLKLSDEGQACLTTLGEAEKQAAARRYRWIAIRLGIEKGDCLSITGDLGGGLAAAVRRAL